MATENIKHAIDAVISRRGTCNVMLTGGNTAAQLYSYWFKNSSLPLEKIHFYFGDERCVQPNSPDSNYAMVLNNLFNGQILKNHVVKRMKAEKINIEAAAEEYGKLLPEYMDVLLLGMGGDGHIASLFPNSKSLSSTSKSVIHVSGPKPPCDRLTITPDYIKKAKSTFLLAQGTEKGKVLMNAFIEPEDVMNLPIRLVLGGVWLVDGKAKNELNLS